MVGELKKEKVSATLGGGSKSNKEIKECFAFLENVENLSIVLYPVKCLFAVAECGFSKQYFYHVEIFHTFNLLQNIHGDMDVITQF